MIYSKPMTPERINKNRYIEGRGCGGAKLQTYRVRRCSRSPTEAGIGPEKLFPERSLPTWKFEKPQLRWTPTDIRNFIMTLTVYRD